LDAAKSSNKISNKTDSDTGDWSGAEIKLNSKGTEGDSDNGTSVDNTAPGVRVELCWRKGLGEEDDDGIEVKLEKRVKAYSEDEDGVELDTDSGVEDVNGVETELGKRDDVSVEVEFAGIWICSEATNEPGAETSIGNDNWEGCMAAEYSVFGNKSGDEWFVPSNP